jgi:putative ABC transport system substrate-binding protein
VKRRVIVSMAGTAALATALPCFAQQASRVYRIGVLSEVIPRPYMALFGALRSLGYEEGRNLLVDFKFAQSKPDLLPALAAELVTAKPDLIAASSNPETAALKRATSSIPIVMMFASTPVETGLISSLARPGGNITGTTMNAPQTVGKMTQVLRETVPHLSRIAWISEPTYPGMDLYLKSADQAAAAMKLRLKHLFVRHPADLDAALATLAAHPPDGLGVSTTGIILANVARVVELAARSKIPALYTTNVPVAGGNGLMSYGPDMNEIIRRHAWMMDKILKGAKASDIPVEEPAKFQLSINLKTARALGLTIPRALLMQADEVIE